MAAVMSGFTSTCIHGSIIACASVGAGRLSRNRCGARRIRAPCAWRPWPAQVIRMPKHALPRVEDALLEANRALETRTQELARSVAILRATLEATTDGILVSDAAHPISMFNRRFVQMWRVPEAILQNRDRAALLEFTAQQLVDGDAYVRRIEQLHAESPP